MPRVIAGRASFHSGLAEVHPRVGVAHGREPPEVDAEDPDEHDALPEARHRVHEDGEAHRAVVPGPVLPHRGDDARWHRDQEPHQHRGEHQGQGRQEGGVDQDPDLLVEDVRVAEVAAGQVAEPHRVLDGDGRSRPSFARSSRYAWSVYSFPSIVMTGSPGISRIRKKTMSETMTRTASVCPRRRRRKRNTGAPPARGYRRGPRPRVTGRRWDRRGSKVPIGRLARGDRSVAHPPQGSQAGRGSRLAAGRWTYGDPGAS